MLNFLPDASHIPCTRANNVQEVRDRLFTAGKKLTKDFQENKLGADKKKKIIKAGLLATPLSRYLNSSSLTARRAF